MVVLIFARLAINQHLLNFAGFHFSPLAAVHQIAGSSESTG